MGIVLHNILIQKIKELYDMVNNGNNQDIVRNVRGAYPHAKDDLLELEAKIADMKAKWEAFNKPAPEPKVEEPEIIEEGPSPEELARAKAEAEKAAKIAELKAQLAELNE